jgi:hypothetical protein
MKFGWTHQNLLINGRLAMLGVMAMIGAYLYSGQVIPGVW